MKVNPMPGTPAATPNPSEGRSAGSDRIARAKAIAVGQAPPERHPLPEEDQAEAQTQQRAPRRILMKTQVSPNRHEKPVEHQPGVKEVAPGEPTEVEKEEKPVTDKLALDEPTEKASEETKLLSPQLAEIARQKRAIQLERQKFLAEQKEHEKLLSDKKSLEEYRSRLKTNALSVLQEEGVTYDQLTEQILASSDSNAELSLLKAEIQALKQGLDTQQKTLTERDLATEKQAIAQIKRDAENLILNGGEKFEMVREAGYAPQVVDLIHRTWKQSGELLDVSEAAELVENELLTESLKLAQIKKVQSRLNPKADPMTMPASSAPVKTDRDGVKIMRTLTNRDGVSSTTMSKRERAIAAMEGRLIK